MTFFSPRRALLALTATTCAAGSAAYLGRLYYLRVKKDCIERSKITTLPTRDLAKRIEARSNEVRDNELLEALEFDGGVSEEVHTALAEDAFWEEDLRHVSQFYKVWIAAVRMEFPLRSNRPADRACMTRWLCGKMREKGIRITHIADVVPRIVAMAINPSRAEVEAEEMAEEADKWRKPLKATWVEWVLGLRPSEAKKPGYMARQ